ncbi:MAG: Ca2+-dependent phosphoinositide-specific phospholipase C [Rubrivivax sp.]
MLELGMRMSFVESLAPAYVLIALGTLVFGATVVLLGRRTPRTTFVDVNGRMMRGRISVGARRSFTTRTFSPFPFVAIVLASACGIDVVQGDTGAPGVPPASADASAPEASLPDGGAPDEDGGSLPIDTEGVKVAYDQVTQKSVHNAYEKDEPLFDQLVWHRVRSVELDIHTGRSGESDMPGDWYVYHEDLPFFRDTTCFRLSECLTQISAFHKAVPQHEVITLMIDLKDGFGGTHGQADLDAMLVKQLGAQTMVSPQNLVAKCAGATTLRAAVTGKCAFPTLADLRGKVVVAVTGGSGCDAASNVSSYVGADPTARLAFGAADLDGSCPMTEYDTRPSFVFFNMSGGESARAADVKARKLVGRIYKGGLDGGLDSASDFAAARTAGAQLLATDRVNAVADTWSTTASPTGFPFACAGCEPPHAEPASLVTLRATSGDTWDAADNFYFAYEQATGETTLSAFASVPSSHVEEWAKGCLMARASDAPGAANVAVCRPFDKHPARIQIRAQDGGSTTSTDLPTPSGLTADTAAFLRLTTRPQGSGTEVVAEASVEGVSYREIARATVGVALPLRGLALSTHGAGPAKVVFGNVTKSAPGTAAKVLGAADLPMKKGIGGGASGSAVDGFAP